jgi:hypothetical protein
VFLGTHDNLLPNGDLQVRVEFAGTELVGEVCHREPLSTRGSHALAGVGLGWQKAFAGPAQALFSAFQQVEEERSYRFRGKEEDAITYANRLLVEFGDSHALSNILNRLARIGLDCVMIERRSPRREAQHSPEGFVAQLRSTNRQPTRLHLLGPEGAEGRVHFGFVDILPSELFALGGRRVGHVDSAVIGFPASAFGKAPLRGRPELAPTGTSTPFGYAAVATRAGISASSLSGTFRTDLRTTSRLAAAMWRSSKWRSTSVGTWRADGSMSISSWRCSRRRRASGRRTAGEAARRVVKSIVEGDFLDRSRRAPAERELADALKTIVDAEPSPDMADFHPIGSFEQFVDLLHVFIDSQLPPLLLLKTDGSPIPDHVVPIVGHTVGETDAVLRAARIGQRRLDFLVDDDLHRFRYRTTTSRVSAFFVHDTYGPELMLSVLGDGAPEDEPNALDRVWEYTVQKNAVGFVAPLPREVHLRPIRALDIALQALFEFALKLDEYCDKHHDTIAGTTRASLEQFRETVLGDPIEDGGHESALMTSLYLDLGNRFRGNVLRQLAPVGGNPSPPLLAETMYSRELPLPNYVWVVELLDYRTKDPFSTLGHIIVHATAREDSRHPVLLWRFASVAFDWVTTPGVRRIRQGFGTASFQMLSQFDSSDDEALRARAPHH